MPSDVPGGYNGKILRVNLSEKTMAVEAIGERFCRRYIGGFGFIGFEPICSVLGVVEVCA